MGQRPKTLLDRVCACPAHSASATGCKAKLCRRDDRVFRALPWPTLRRLAFYTFPGDNMMMSHAGSTPVRSAGDSQADEINRACPFLIP
jgi:hypothetical protein